jgi:replicative DNA helicase
MNKEKFSYFLPLIKNTYPDKVLTLVEVWEYITGRKPLEISRKTGKDVSHLGTLQAMTHKVRTLSPEEYSSREDGVGKTSYLPLVTFGGVYDYRSADSRKLREKGKEGLLETSGLVNLDIDHISQLGLSLEDLKDRLSKDREIGLRLLFTSPSGDGLKLVCKTSGEITDKDSYRREFETLNHFVSQRYSIPIGEIGLDKGISDITRGCLLCYDPEAILTDWEDVFHSESHPLPKVESPRPRRLQGETRTDRNPSGVEESVEDVKRDTKDWEDNTLIPALFPYIDRMFPDMGFIYSESREEWESPLKRDGTPAKTHRPEKTLISREKPWGVFEQGGGKPIGLTEYYMQRNSLQYGEALRELSRICGLEEEYRDLSRRYAKAMERETYKRNKTSSTDVKQTSGGVSQTPTPETSLEEKYKDFLTIPDLRKEASTKKEGIKTGYHFTDPQSKKVEEFILPSGALTLICGKSSHGKSRLLQNLALRIASQEYNSGGEGVVLYFHFEESKISTIARVANMSINIPELSKFDTPNTEVLRDYWETGKLNKASERKRTEALPKITGFEALLNSGKLRIYYTPDLKSGELCELLSWMSSKLRIKAVFLDYLQAMGKENYRRERREELREVCKDVNKLSIDLNLPIVLSAQLNRSTESPTAMSGDNISESADITQYADTILLMWDSKKIRDIKGERDKYLNSQDYSDLQGKGFELGKPGKLYAVLEKNRGRTPGVEAVLDYIPETGKILDNEDLPEGEDRNPGLNML